MKKAGLAIIKKIGSLIRVRKTLTKVRGRTDLARAELKDAENVEQLIEGLFKAYDEMLDEIDKAGQSVQRATTKVRNIVKERKQAISEVMEINLDK